MKSVCGTNRFITSIIFFLIAIECFADEQRIQTKFESPNKDYSIQCGKKKWIVKDKFGKPLYKIVDQGFTSMTIFLSDDGQKVLVINDFMEGHQIGKRNAIWIFNKGKLLNSFRFIDLIQDSCNVASTIWHTIWCLDDIKFINNQTQFSVSTFEFSDIIFDLNTGQIISNKKPEGFDNKTLLLFVEFRKGNREETAAKILRYISGEIQKNNQISFKTKYYGVGLWRVEVMIKDGIDITPDRYRNLIFLNNCLLE